MYEDDDEAEGRELPDPHALLCAWLDGDRKAGERLLTALALDPLRVYLAVR